MKVENHPKLKGKKKKKSLSVFQSILIYLFILKYLNLSHVYDKNRMHIYIYKKKRVYLNQKLFYLFGKVQMYPQLPRRKRGKISK